MDKIQKNSSFFWDVFPTELYAVYNVDTVHTVHTVHTVQTSFHRLKSSMSGKVRMLLEWADALLSKMLVQWVTGLDVSPLECYDF